MLRQNAVLASQNIPQVISANTTNPSNGNVTNGNGVVSVQPAPAISGDTSQTNAASNKAYYART